MTRIVDLYEKFADETNAAAAVLDHLGVAGDAKSVLLPLVEKDIAEWERELVLRIERSGKADTPTDSKLRAPAAASNPLLRAQLLSATFALGDGRRVLWGRATVKDHVARVAFLTQMINGVRATIALHQDAVAAIEAKRGAKCLNDLLPKEVAA